MSRYDDRGVSARKDQVHAAVAQAGNDRGLFPGAFCQLFPDVLIGDESFCGTLHGDGAGSKLVVAYLGYLARKARCGELDHQAIKNLFWGIAQDSIVMNTDDLICVGSLGPFPVLQLLNRNSFLINGEILNALLEGTQRFCRRLTELGIPCYPQNGETADLPNQVRTATVDNVVSMRMLRRDVIDASRMQPGDLIVGFSSTGQADWEDEPNSGIGSNGLTGGQHDLLQPGYRRVIEAYAPEAPRNLIFCGELNLEDPLPGDGRFTIESALLSPTRTYAPLVKRILEEVPRDQIHALIHCSGGGQTKIGKFGRPGNVYLKTNPFPVPPLFQTIQRVSGLPWREMYECYNMGHRFEAVVQSREVADVCISISQACGIDARVVGKVKHDVALFARGERRVVVEPPVPIEEPLTYPFKVA